MPFIFFYCTHIFNKTKRNESKVDRDNARIVDKIPPSPTASPQ